MEIKCATIYAETIAVLIKKDLGISGTKELISEDAVDKWLKDKYGDGIKFHLSELDDITSELKKILKVKKKKKADFEQGDSQEKSNTGYGGDRNGIWVEPSRDIKSEEKFIVYKSINNAGIDKELYEDIKTKLTEAHLPGSYFKMIPDGFAVKKDAVTIVDGILGGLQAVNFVKTEVDQKQLDEMSLISSSKDAAIPPKPTDTLSPDEEYVFDPNTNTWIKQMKKASLTMEQIKQRKILCSNQLKTADDEKIEKIVEEIKNKGTEAEFVSPNYVNDIAQRLGIQLTSDEVVYMII
jgi:hypothetical protein